MLGWKKTFGNRHNFLKKNNPKKHNIEGLELAIKWFERCGYRHNCNLGGLDIDINWSGGQHTFREGLELDIDYVYFHPFHTTNMFMSNLPKITNMFISTYLISPCLVPLWLIPYIILHFPTILRGSTHIDKNIIFGWEISTIFYYMNIILYS